MATFSFHAGAKTVFAGPFQASRLEGLFHGSKLARLLYALMPVLRHPEKGGDSRLVRAKKSIFYSTVRGAVALVDKPCG